MPRIVVCVSGGVVQDIVSDTDGVEVMLVNYDEEEEGDAQPRSFESVTCNPRFVARTIAHTEDSDLWC